MPYIQLDEQQFVLGADETLVGSREDAHIKVGGEGDGAIYALIKHEADGTTVIRRGLSEEPVRVNGVALGAEPVPLVHGDKIDVAGKLLIFGSAPAVGSTQMLAGVRPGELARTPAVNRPAASVDGRMVSQVDGREYVVPPAGLVIGRDPSCDVVIASNQVSRRHAMIAPTDAGYVITDTSTNGLQVNGQAVTGSRTLSRGDVVRVGEEEFRFYAQSAPPAPADAPVETPAVALVEPPVEESVEESVEEPAPAATAAIIDEPAPPSASRPPAMASLEITNEGVLKGRRFEIRTPLTHIGRGAHNDFVINDLSVSETHAKLQRREGGWFIVDMGSTNGTYVGGRRINGEHTLAGAPDVRFGNVKCLFQVIRGEQQPGPEAHGTRVIAPVGAADFIDTPAVTPRYAPSAAKPAPEPPEPVPEPRQGLPVVVWLGVLLAAALAAIFILSSR
jgi:pSer/pThr/pTyr-binding forkhead associated (FHA) protein